MGTDTMPSPVGHALGGAIVGALLAKRDGSAEGPFLLRAWRLATTPLGLASMAAACAPDLDLLWGRHTMESHSLGAAALAGLAAALVSRRDRGRVGVAVALAWGTHVLFDWLGSDDTPPLGVMALWPWSDAFYFADAHAFPAISRRYWRPGFLAHNLGAVATEIALLAPGLVLLVLFRVRRTTVRPHARPTSSLPEESS